MMVKVLLYGYATGTFSSRKLARKLHEDVAFRVLGAGSFPAHRTLSDFRANHLEALSELFVQIVRLARECGLVRLGTVAIDGTKVKANAGRHKAMSYRRRLETEAKLRARVDELMERAKAADAAEAEQPELDLPDEIARRDRPTREAPGDDRRGQGAARGAPAPGRSGARTQPRRRAQAEKAGRHASKRARRPWPTRSAPPAASRSTVSASTARTGEASKRAWKLAAAIGAPLTRPWSRRRLAKERSVPVPKPTAKVRSIAIGSSRRRRRTQRPVESTAATSGGC